MGTNFFCIMGEDNKPLLHDPAPYQPGGGAPGVPTIFPENPIRMTCNFCNNSIVTRTNPKSGALTFLLAAILCLIGLWCCAWIPLVIDAGKDIEHVCPSCNNLLGVRKHF